MDVGGFCIIKGQGGIFMQLLSNWVFHNSSKQAPPAVKFSTLTTKNSAVMTLSIDKSFH